MAIDIEEESESQTFTRVAGYIEQLEVENFKSYRDRQIIGPFKKFQSIIGPNGAGKSNLMDAISFVLGVKTSQLRGSTLADLIYRPDGQQLDPNASCSIKLIWFNEETREDTVFQRRIVQKQGKATSEYLIDAETVKKEEYVDALKNIGVLVKARNFLVFQGEVEAIASQTPKELTAMIETIAGSDELKASYDSYLNDKNQAEETTVYNFQRKKGISAEKKQYKEQKKEAEKYNTLVENRTKLERDQIMWQLYHIEKDLEDIILERRGKVKELEKLREESKKLEDELKGKKKEQGEVQKRYLDIQRKVRTAVTDAEKNKPETEKLEQEIKRTNERLSQSKKSLAQINEEDKRQKKTVKDLKKQLDDVEAAQKRFEDQIEEDITQVTFTDEQIATYNEKKQEVYRDTAADQQNLARLKRNQKSDTESLESLTQKLEEYKGKMKQIQVILEQLNSRQTKMQEFIDTHTQKSDELKEKMESQKKQNQSNDSRQKELSAQLETIQEKLREAKGAVRQSEREVRFRETLDALKRLYPGVYGSITDIAKPTNNKYDLAVTVAIGNMHMDAIVVDNKKTATECIQVKRHFTTERLTLNKYLREQRAMVCTFIPIDDIQVKSVEDRLRKLGHNIKPVLDVINFDPMFEKAMLYVVGSTLVCDTLDQARRLAFDDPRDRKKVVTLGGVLIAKSGLMTSNGKQTRSNVWNDRRIDDLKKQRDNLLRELGEIGRGLRSADLEQQYNSQISAIDNRVKYATIDLGVTKEKINENETMQQNITEEITKTEKAIKELQKKTKATEEEIDTVSETIHTTEDAIFSTFCESVGVDDIRVYEETSLKAAQERATRRVEFSGQISRLRDQLTFEEKRDLKSVKERVQATIQEDEESLEQLQARIDAASTDNNDKKEKVKQLQDQQEEIRREFEEGNSAIKTVRMQLNTVNNETAKLERNVSAFDSALDQDRAKRNNILNKVRMEEITLDTKGKKRKAETEADAEEEESSSSEGEGGEAERTSTNAQYTADEEFISKLAFSSKKFHRIKGKRQYEDYNEKTFVLPIQNVTAEIEKLTPNMKALNKFDEVKEKLSEAEREFEEVRSTHKEAQDAFNAIKQKRYTLFMSAFDKISKSIDSIYKKITQNNSSRAYLTLENLQEPYLEGIKFNAIPPSKRFRDMEQLSGGEKTVAALALLFAIHSFRPSPFFILDEVDAALDAGNVANVANYIQERSEDLQCIVISLKDTFYSKARALVGIYKDQKTASSSTLTLDLENYRD
ncbi:structural maintenance of chromosomes 1A [Planoprotostelium fungivorum]|uniref:Structural maintenance of chromosomes protein n=1 Tax=Planoprotostelium fungivorum TaxID=1890364 RepID=A0A2P6NQN7_9EUKA|nr:structural maintenance of chromosomes 1A [Planoprotostelium fungivorum]